MLTREQCREAVRLLRRAMRGEPDDALRTDIGEWLHALERLPMTKVFDRDWPAPVTLLCSIEGGVLQGCQANDPEVTIIVRDHDNMSEGDPDPMEFYRDGATGEVDWEAAGLPHAVF